MCISMYKHYGKLQSNAANTFQQHFSCMSKHPAAVIFDLLIESNSGFVKMRFLGCPFPVNFGDCLYMQ